MNPDIGELIVRWTARLVVTAYLVRLLSDIAGGSHCSRRSLAERSGLSHKQAVLWIWTIGCGIYLLHVAAAFHFVHHWSHAAAFEHTADQTAVVTGWKWGGGLWINYAFTLWWPLDVLWCWRRGLDRLPRWYVITMHTIVGFLVFNATVVFGPTGWRWVTAGFGLMIVALLFSRRFGNRTNSSNSPSG